MCRHKSEQLDTSDRRARRPEMASLFIFGCGYCDLSGALYAILDTYWKTAGCNTFTKFTRE